MKRLLIALLLLMVILVACQSDMEKASDRAHEAVTNWKTTAPLLRR